MLLEAVLFENNFLRRWWLMWNTFLQNYTHSVFMYLALLLYEYSFPVGRFTLSCKVMMIMKPFGAKTPFGILKFKNIIVGISLHYLFCSSAVRLSSNYRARSWENSRSETLLRICKCNKYVVNGNVKKLSSHNFYSLTFTP